MEFLTNPWVIGIGTAVIAGVILYFTFRIWIPKSKHDQISTEVPGQSTTSDITPNNIISYLKSLPPLQQESAAEHHKGIRVSWKVTLEGGTTLSDGESYLLMLYEGKSLSPLVTCSLDPNKYPILRVTKKTQLFTVEGEIEEVTLSEIRLKNCRLFF